jgi:hypothetical protein
MSGYSEDFARLSSLVWCYTLGIHRVGFSEDAVGQGEKSARKPRRGGRAAECGGLLNRCRGQNSYRGFESPPLRQNSPNCIQRRDLLQARQHNFKIAFRCIQDEVLANCWPESEESARRLNAGCSPSAVRGRSTPSPKLNFSCRQGPFACLSSSIRFCIFSAASRIVRSNTLI